MIAARDGHAEVVSMLLKAGADFKLRNKKRETASEIALAAGYSAIAEMLR